MKSLSDYIKECDFATPMNTIGMGDVSVNNDIISEPIEGKPHKLKKIKKNKIKKEEK